MAVTQVALFPHYLEMSGFTFNPVREAATQTALSEILALETLLTAFKTASSGH